MKTNILILLAILLMTACRKDDVVIDPSIVNPATTYDTIKPKSYLPYFPGSWWKYQLNDTAEITISTSSTYILHSYLDYINYDLLNTDSVYVPFYNSEPVYGYDKIEYIAPPFGGSYKKWPILSEVVGFSFNRDWTDPRWGDFNEKVQVSEKIFNGQDSVIILKGHWVYGPKISWKSYQEYTKGVGLTKEFIVDTLTNDTVLKKILIDYYINQ